MLREKGSFLYPAWMEIYADHKVHRTTQHGKRCAVPERDWAATFRDARAHGIRRIGDLIGCLPFDTRIALSSVPCNLCAKENGSWWRGEVCSIGGFDARRKGFFRFRDAGERRPRQCAGENFSISHISAACIGRLATWSSTARFKKDTYAHQSLVL